MEQKAMGEFIAALRKANGLTQKQLAEKLNVSDKSVSRWECGDGAPDLALIPVLAEVFGVTCDELLRGARRAPDAPPPAGPDPRAEKQRARLLSSTLSRFRDKSIAAVAFAVAGVCLAAGIDLGLFEAVIALCVGAVCLLGAAVIQAIACNNALLAVAGEEPEHTAPLRASVLRGSEHVFTAILAMLAFLLPLALVGSYGLTLGSWLGYGLPAALVMWVACGAVCQFLNVRFLDTGTLTLPPAQAEALRRNARLLRRCLLGLGGAALLTLAAHAVATGFWQTNALAPKTTFDDWASFAAYMEEEIPDPDAVYPEAPAPDDWLNAGGEPADGPDEEQYYPIDITDADGNVVCTFVKRNGLVKGWGYSVDSGRPVPPVWVRTAEDYRQGDRLLARRNTIFAVLYLTEAAVTAAVWLLRRRRVRR